jgi:hypothetical protein
MQDLKDALKADDDLAPFQGMAIGGTNRYTTRTSHCNWGNHLCALLDRAGLFAPALMTGAVLFLNLKEISPIL